MYIPFNFAKISKSRHFTGHRSKNLKLSPGTAIDSTFQKYILESLLLFSFVCYQVVLSCINWTKISSSTARNLNNSWLIYVTYSKMISISRNIWVVENFFFGNKRRQKRQNVQFFKRSFVRNEWPYGYDFWCVFRNHCEASKKYNFAVFLKIQQKL